MNICTIQARIGSTRFPGKVMEKIDEKRSVLEFLIDRLGYSKHIDRIVILTTINEKDGVIEDFCKDKKVEYFRGSEEDVLGRMSFYAYWSKLHSSDVVIDITSDCPLVDPYMIDSMIYKFEEHGYDYYSNVITRGYPDGFDVQIYYVEIIYKVHNLVSNLMHRQHTGWNILHYSGILQAKDMLKIGNDAPSEYLFRPDMELTLDYKEDLELLKTIVSWFDNDDFSITDVIKNIDLKKPNMKKMDRKIPGK